MDKFIYSNMEEQETIINIDYYTKEVIVYTCRKNVYDRIVEKIGEPTTKYYVGKKISGANWKIPFKDKIMINKILSRPLLIGGLK